MKPVKLLDLKIEALYIVTGFLCVKPFSFWRMVKNVHEFATTASC